MSKKKELKFNLEPVDLEIKKPKINKVIIPKIEPVTKIHGFRKNRLTEKYEKVDETEKEYLEKLKVKPIKTDYIQDIYNKMKKERESK